jgi:hypothetical protein
MIETRGMLLQGGENLREESVVGREVTNRTGYMHDRLIAARES